ncbi:helix-hairpin-helix domain-containing protein [Arcticibacter tournemirensis]|uniref:DNA polymerase/3'-5' exonuclease PolX n=1 Tax=Arcticibacter tournemirensis TaxID=699437 RepID=A0A4Q0ME37_9SPHI|nr:helix-hairpin-helix domain-containing protein [Arcticibacter tournemirensis]RXF71086.1 DNA polymerase/3'-5' exonuclease PolX [Arcticibacter tournemirensis]
MENKTIARTLRLLSQLMEIHNENPFKVKSFSSAAYTVDKLPYPLSKKTLAEIEKISGIGKSTSAKVWELLQTGKLQELEDFRNRTPEGIIEIMSIKGLGPKKILVIWKDLEIENLGELLYACNENRLIEAKGFGLKTQEEIKKAIEFKMASSGRFLYAHVQELAEQVLAGLKQVFPSQQMSFTGPYRRKCEIIDSIGILIAAPLSDNVYERINAISELAVTEKTENTLTAVSPAGMTLHISFCKEDDFVKELLIQTGSSDHIEELTRRLNNSIPPAATETEIYSKAGLPFIEPELREGHAEFSMAEAGKLPQLLEHGHLNGVLHCHSTWSDGVNTLREMAEHCRDELSLQYLGISDHSKTAFYAKGLSEERVLAQHDEIAQLNQELAPFKIFKGIESDILFDGSLDYSPEILATFDFVVASIHSVFRMSEEKATSRLIKAIENPYTTILGHPTGRLLLARNGYPVDFKKVIDACAANGVVIEINANPLRLDMDWRWHQYAIEKGVMLSVNPDAHSNKGFNDTHYGVLAARKGGVSPMNCLNALNLDEISSFFKGKRLVN